MAPLVVSHHLVLPDDMKGSHSKTAVHAFKATAAHRPHAGAAPHPSSPARIVTLCSSARSVSLLPLVRRRAAVFWFILKKTDVLCHTRTVRPRVAGNLGLFARPCYRLLFPVKTGKDRGENGGLESAAAKRIGWKSSSVRR